jgi:hypothetical protein
VDSDGLEDVGRLQHLAGRLGELVAAEQHRAEVQSGERRLAPPATTATSPSSWRTAPSIT